MRDMGKMALMLLFGDHRMFWDELVSFCGPRGCVLRSVDDLDRRGGRFMPVVLAFHVFINYTTMLICFEISFLNHSAKKLCKKL